MMNIIDMKVRMVSNRIRISMDVTLILCNNSKIISIDSHTPLNSGEHTVTDMDSGITTKFTIIHISNAILSDLPN